MGKQSSIRLVALAEIQEWLITYLVEELNLKKDEIDVQAHFADFGLDSSTAVILTGDLGEWLGYDLDPTLLKDYLTLEALVHHLNDNENR